MWPQLSYVYSNNNSQSFDSTCIPYPRASGTARPAATVDPRPPRSAPPEDQAPTVETSSPRPGRSELSEVDIYLLHHQNRCLPLLSPSFVALWLRLRSLQAAPLRRVAPLRWSCAPLRWAAPLRWSWVLWSDRGLLLRLRHSCFHFSRFYLPRFSSSGWIASYWVSSLAYWADCWARVLEAYRVATDWFTVLAEIIDAEM